MKRVQIVNTYGQMYGGDFDDPTQWLSQGIAGNWWGLPERTKWKDECTPDELSMIKSESEVVFRPAVPAQDAKYRTQVKMLNGDIRWKDTLLEEELAQIVQEEEIEIVPAQPEQDAIYRTEVVLKATYTIDIQDVSQEYLQRDADAHIATIQAQCDQAVLELLNGREKSTINAFALKNFWIAANLTGAFTDQERTNAIAICETFFQLLSAIENLMNQRDADIAAYKASVGL